MRRIGRTWIILSMVVSIIMILAGCGSQVNKSQSTVEKLKVVTTVYPVYEFTRQVGGDKVDVVMLIPPGAEPHDWEPTAKEIAQIKSAKLFLYHGAGLEPVGKLLTKEILGDTPATEISKGIELLTEAAGPADEEDEDHHEHARNQEKSQPDSHHQHIDAHVWLDPVYAQQEVNNIAEALAKLDPQNREYYVKNAERFSKELAQLDQDYKAALATAARRDIITSHAAFGYLAKRYNLKQVAIMGLSPDSEPTPDRMARVVDFCREHNVNYIFFETLVSPKLSETIAKETGAGLLVLNPIENLTAEEIQQGKTYLSIMRENLANLQKALHN